MERCADQHHAGIKSESMAEMTESVNQSHSATLILIGALWYDADEIDLTESKEKPKSFYTKRAVLKRKVAARRIAISEAIDSVIQHQVCRQAVRNVLTQAALHRNFD